MEKSEFDKLKVEARQADLIQFFQESGYTMKKQGHEYYLQGLEGHTISINPDSKVWYDHYTGDGGKNAIDCVMHTFDYNFNQAVYALTGRDITTERSSSFPKEYAPRYTSPPKSATPKPEKKELVMPERADNMRRMFAYFCKTRKIPAPIIEELVHAGLLYQSAQNGNAVFVHKDAQGKVTGAEIQGTNSYKRFKGVAAGTGESAFTFMPYPTADGKPKRAYLFESAIDMMSFYTFCKKEKLQGVMLVSMAGLKPTVPKQLEAEGVKIISCVDNDDAGRRFEAENNFPRSESVKQHLDDQGFKDWNELLVFRSGGEGGNTMGNASEMTKPDPQLGQPVFTRRR